MSLLSSIRITEWWEYKLPPLLSLAYASTLFLEADIMSVVNRLPLAVLGFILSASYVSILNDFTDLKEDKRAGKRNRLARFSSPLRILLLSLSILLCLLFLYWIRDDITSMLFMSSALICYTLYSAPPIRLKTKRIWGLLADAAGAHLFSGLFFCSMASHALDQQLSLFWMMIVAAWSLSYGLRGILWHQFTDRSYDEIAGLNTAGRSLSNSQIKVIEWGVTIIEMTALILLLTVSGSMLPFVALLIYIIMLLSYHFRGTRIILAQPISDNWHIFLSDYYQIYLPISLLVAGTLVNSSVWILIAIHILIFPVRLKSILKDLYGILFLRNQHLSGTDSL